MTTAESDLDIAEAHRHALEAEYIARTRADRLAHVLAAGFWTGFTLVSAAFVTFCALAVAWLFGSF